MTDKDVGGLFAHTLASLLHSGEHGVAGYGALTIGESADRYVVRHLEAHALGGIHNAYGSVVVDGKESIRVIIFFQQFGGYCFCVRTIVAEEPQLFVKFNPMTLKGVLISVEPVLGYFKSHWRTEESNTLATGFDEMAYSIICSLIVIHHHSVGIHTSANTVIKHQWNTILQKLVEVVILGCILCLRHYDAAYLVLIERLTYLHLAFIFLITLCNHDAIVPCPGLFLDTGKDCGEIVVGQFGHDNPDNLRLHHLAVAQRLCKEVGEKVVLLGILLYGTPFLLADSWRVLERSRHCCHRGVKLACNVLHCQLNILFHCY